MNDIQQETQYDFFTVITPQLYNRFKSCWKCLEFKLETYFLISMWRLQKIDKNEVMPKWTFKRRLINS